MAESRRPFAGGGALHLREADSDLRAGALVFLFGRPVMTQS